MLILSSILEIESFYGYKDHTARWNGKHQLYDLAFTIRNYLIQDLPYSESSGAEQITVRKLLSVLPLSRVIAA